MMKKKTIIAFLLVNGALLFLPDMAVSGSPCVDRINCGWVLRKGVCKSRNWAMKRVIQLCKKSCGLCKERKLPTCRDLNRYCGHYKRYGHCRLLTSFMRTNCKRTCGLCSSQVCADKNSNCPYWARTKQCQVNPRYMLRNCRKSCKVCGVVKPKPTPKPTRVTVGVKKGENVARRRPTKQSSIHHKGSPNRAVDGKRSTSYAANSCTHTGWDFHPWWRVDIGNPNSKVESVQITNRGDCCWHRLQKVEVRVGNVDNNPSGNDLCASHKETFGRGETKDLRCIRPINGRYVYVVLRTVGFLTLCEVEVYLHKVPTTKSKPVTPPVPTTKAKPVTPPVPTTKAKPVTPPVPTTKAKPVTPPVPTTKAKPVTPPFPTTKAKPVTPPVPTTKSKPVTPPVPTTKSNPVTPPVPTTKSNPVTPPVPTTKSKPVTPPFPTTKSKPVTPPVPTTKSKPVTPPFPTTKSKPVIPPFPTTKSDTKTPPIPVIDKSTEPPLTIPPPSAVLNSFLCGQPSRNVIVGGAASVRGQWPWMVAVTKVASPNQIWCGATMVSDRWALSAAHCFRKPDRNDPTKYLLRIGEHDLNKSGDEVLGKISKILLHKKYNKTTYDYDVALLKLDKPVTFNRAVRPICLPFRNVNYQPGSKCIVAGWGYNKELRGSLPNLLHAVEVPIIAPQTCRTKFQKFKKVVTSQMMCAGHLEGGKDSCQGDSGGPLLCRPADGGKWEQVGIVSWGIGCARKDLYGVYTEIIKIRSWLEAKMNPFVQP